MIVLKLANKKTFDFCSKNQRLCKNVQSAPSLLASVVRVAPLHCPNTTNIYKSCFKFQIDFFYSYINKIYNPKAYAFGRAFGKGFFDKSKFKICQKKRGSRRVLFFELVKNYSSVTVAFSETRTPVCPVSAISLTAT